MTWLLNPLQWYAFILIIGLAFFPLTKRLFNRFSFDLGYPFAKVLAIIFTTYVIFVLGIFKLLPFNRMSLFLILGIFIFINYVILHPRSVILNLPSVILNLFQDQMPKLVRHDSDTNRKKPFLTRYTLYVILFEEFLFLAAFLFWTYVRSQEPSIRSLEKFMDFGFMNSILRSDFFPPKDIWYPPYPINYYYFGHLTGAFLIKLTSVKASIGYNLMLATIFGLGVTQVFSIVANIIRLYTAKIKNLSLVLFGLIGAFIVNLGGNLHTIYLFTKGYPNEEPVPFWNILSGYNPLHYWYPNATRFIPLTIHEFPSYSYVVADLHGHVFDIPFVLLTIAILFLFFTSKNILNTKYLILNTIFLGFLTAVHYMTNAFDGMIYMLLIAIIFIYLFSLGKKLFIGLGFLIVSFIVFSLPFSSHFAPFITGIGVNCSLDFLTKIGRIGPFIFEKGNCQASPFWMIFVLWGFFWINLVLFLIINRNKKPANNQQSSVINFLFLLFGFGTLLIFIPEFFYIKDIYPAHFRANTMFKLGYQAFMMMGIASALTIFFIKSAKKTALTIIMTFIWLFFFFFILVYPFFSIPSYYGALDRPAVLDGTQWLKKDYPQDMEIIEYLNQYEKGQPTILEAQGDSYTDYERISAMTGLPTVAGWWVHEWLWRGSSEIIGKRIPEIETIYQSKDVNLTKQLLKKYKVKYVIVSGMEKEKYPGLYESKFKNIGRLVYKSSNGLGALYQIN